MVKTVALLRARESDLQSWLIEEIAARPWAVEADRIALQLAIVEPAGDGGGPARLLYDAVIECWGPRALCEQIARDRDIARRAEFDLRPSVEAVAKGQDDWRIGQTPGISQLTFLSAQTGMARAEAQARWARHVPLALEVHFGMNRYVQDHLAPGEAGDWFGMAHLHFADARALREGLFRRDEDIDRIAADVAGFVGNHATVLATEHVVKA